MASESHSTRSSLSDSTQYYLWTFPGSPITIKIAVDVIWRLNLELDLELELDKRGAKPRNAMGLLVGTLDFTGAMQVQITDYAAFSSDVDPSDTAAQSALLEQNMARLAQVPVAVAEGQRVVGLFRTQSETRPVIRACDRPLLNMAEHPEIQVVLMIACGDNGRRVAGFLFREGDTIHPFSFMDFEFDATLRNEPHAAFLLDEGLATEEENPEPPAPVETADTVHAPVLPAPERKAVRSRSLAVVMACLAGIVAGVLGTLGTWLVLTTWTAVSPLHLMAVAVDDGVALTWTPPVSATPLGGRLVIREKSEETVIELDPNQIAAGKLYFGQVGRISQFKLEVGDRTHPQMSDSISSISNRTPPGN